MFKLGSVVVDYIANTKPFEGGVKTVNESIKKTGAETEKTKGKFKMFGDAGQRAFAMSAGAAGAGLLLGALVSITNEALKFNDELDGALARSRGSLNLTAEETEKMGDRAKQAYLDGFGTSIADVTGQLTNMQKQIQSLGNVSDEEFRSIANDILGITDVFEQDADRVSMSVNTLMTELGVTAKEATAMIASGLQNGMDNSGDFLDSINEYSTQFATAGASADEMFNIMIRGQKAGVLGTDKIADSFKEFFSILSDQSESQQEAFDSLNLTHLYEQVQKGEKTVAEAFSETALALSKIEDPLERRRLGIGVLGTMNEDLAGSTETLSDLADINSDKWTNNTEALDAVAESYNTTQLKGEALQRQMEVTRAEALEPLTDAVNQAKLKFFELMQPLAENQPLLIGVMTAVGLLAVAMGMFALVMAVTLIPTMWATAGAGWAMISPFLAMILPFLAIIAVVGLLWWAFSSNFLGIRDIVDNVFGWITNTALPWFMNGLNSAWQGVKKFGEQVGNVFNGLKNVVGSAMKFVANALVGSFNFQINGINKIINGANKVPGVSIPNIPNIPTFAQGVKNFGGGLAMINDGISNEALRVGDVTYLPQGTDVINGGATNDLLSRSGGGATTILSLRDVSTPMIKNWVKENLQIFKQAGVQIN